MTSDVVMDIDGWWCPHVFSEPFCKCSAWFPSVLFLTVHPSSLLPVDHTTFLQDGVPIFGMYQEVPDGVAPSEIHFNPMFSADVPAAFSQTLHIWDHYVGLFAACVGLVLVGPMFVFILNDLVSVQTHGGYLHLLNALLRWTSSSFNRWWLE